MTHYLQKFHFQRKKRTITETEMEVIPVPQKKRHLTEPEVKVYQNTSLTVTASDFVHDYALVARRPIIPAFEKNSTAIDMYQGSIVEPCSTKNQRTELNENICQQDYKGIGIETTNTDQSEGTKPVLPSQADEDGSDSPMGTDSDDEGPEFVNNPRPREFVTQISTEY